MGINDDLGVSRGHMGLELLHSSRHISVTYPATVFNDHLWVAPGNVLVAPSDLVGCSAAASVQMAQRKHPTKG